MDEDKKQSFTEKISSSFLRGLLVIVPPVITIFVLKWLTTPKRRPAQVKRYGLSCVFSLSCLIFLPSRSHATPSRDNMNMTPAPTIAVIK